MEYVTIIWGQKKKKKGLDSACLVCDKNRLGALW